MTLVGQGRTATASGKHSPRHSKNELQERLDYLNKEREELNTDMDTNVSMWIHDFMNLVFGLSDE